MEKSSWMTTRIQKETKTCKEERQRYCFSMSPWKHNIVTTCSKKEEMAFCTIECMEELKHYKSTEKADHNGSDEKKLMKPNVNSMSSNGVQMRQIMNELMNI
ncbi:hypothetical protein M513_07981, partial [Trichuris suis]